MFLTEQGRILASGRVAVPSMWPGVGHRFDGVGDDGDDDGALVHDVEEEEGYGGIFLQNGGQRSSASSHMYDGVQSSALSSGGKSKMQAGRFDGDGVHAMASASHQETSWASMHLVPFIDHRPRSLEMQHAKYMYSDSIRSMSEKYSASKAWADHMSGEDALSTVALPTLLGGGAGLMGKIIGTGKNEILASRMKSIHSCISSGKSIAINEFNVPVMLEPLKTKLYGFQKDGVPASWMQASVPHKMVLGEIENNGGAVKAGAGEGYYAVLTSNGNVIVWWSDAVPGPSNRTLDEKSTKYGIQRIRIQDGTAMFILSGVPALCDIAMSPGAISCTDGSSVWHLSIPSSNNFSDIGHPRRILQFEDIGIKKLVAGGRSWAAVTDAGTLWIWGTVLTHLELEKALQYAEMREGFGHWSYGSDPISTNVSSWPGLGGDMEPREVPGLHGVSDIALGMKHAIATVA